MPEGVELNRNREPFAVNWNERLAKARLQALDLPWTTPEPSREGEVWNAGYIVRLAGRDVVADRRESTNAERARELGAQAPVCHEVSPDASVWSRLPGRPMPEAPFVDRTFWRDLSHDLARLHALPATNEAFCPISTNWIELAGKVPGLDPSELRLLSRIASEPIPPRRLAFCHTQVTGNHLIVRSDGTYGGLIDWRYVGWWPPERDYALLPTEGLRQTMDWPFEPVNWLLVATLRVIDRLERVANGEMRLLELHEAMGLWELMR